MFNKILVTGASGFIGSHLTEKLLEQENDVRVLIRQNKPLEIRGEERLDKRIGDLLEPQEKLENICSHVHTVFHCAAELKMGVVSNETLERSNIDGTKNLFYAAVRAGVSVFIFCSSVGVLGHIYSGAADEMASPNPEDFYEFTKYEAEKFVLSQVNHEMRVVVVRPAWVYGPGDKRTLKLFRLIAKNRFFLIGQGKNKQHPVHVSDVVTGMIKAGECAVPQGTIIHLAGPRIVTLSELVQTAAHLLGARVLPFTFPLFLARIIASILEPLFKFFGKEAPLTRGKIGFFWKNRAYLYTNAEKFLDYQPRIGLSEGLSTTFAWYKKRNLL